MAVNEAYGLIGSLLPENVDPGTVLPADGAERLQRRWQDLLDLGFDLELCKDSLLIRHEDQRFETVIHLSHGDDLGERRALFQHLKRSFGCFTDRFFPWLFQPSPAITHPYECLKEVVSACHGVHQRCRSSAALGPRRLAGDSRP